MSIDIINEVYDLIPATNMFSLLLTNLPLTFVYKNEKSKYFSSSLLLFMKALPAVYVVKQL
jgi:hypothetical protein